MCLIIEIRYSMNELNSTLDSADERTDELEEGEISRMQHKVKVLETMKESLCNMDSLRK